MSEAFNNSYFHMLPNEILIKIIGSIDTFTILNFCEVYECDYFLQDRNVIKIVDLYKQYLFPDLNLLSKKIAFSHVTTLNINCVYWIAAYILRKFVIKLVNLKNLYAIKTHLSLTPSDVEVYKTIQVEKLAVTVRKNDEMGFSKVPSVKTLYINFLKPTSLLTPLTLEIHFPQLTKLWIDVEEPSSAYPVFSSLSPGIKTKIFCSINAPIPFINFEGFGHRKYYNNRRPDQFYEMCCEKFCPDHLSAREDNKVGVNSSEPWKILNELHCPIPYGPRDARRLYLNEASMDDILFEELNFHHSGPTCIQRCREAQKEILKSPNAKNLKKLSFMTCLLDNNSSHPVSLQTSNGFKRKRVGVVNTTVSHSAQDIFGNVQNLECLEIFCCLHVVSPNIIQAYPFLGKCDKLSSLTLEIPVIVDGTFLIEVFKNCKLLETVKVTALAQNEKLSFNICNALPNALALKNFRFENRRIPLDKLIERLCLIRTQKLERLVLICHETDKFSSAPLKELLESNPQLTFIYFLIRQATETSLKMAQRTLNSYKKKHPSKSFFAKTSEVKEMGYPIPDIHFCEMLKVGSNVATLQVFEDFETF